MSPLLTFEGVCIYPDSEAKTSSFAKFVICLHGDFQGSGLLGVNCGITSIYTQRGTERQRQRDRNHFVILEHLRKGNTCSVVGTTQVRLSSLWEAGCCGLHFW